MAFFTYGELRTPLTQSINENLYKSSHITTQGKTVFLSHSTQDHDYVVGVIQLLEKHGATTYVDDGDERLPKTPNQETANVLKQSIASCPRFIVIVSPNSFQSRWIPWELGLADISKGVARVAVFPIAPTAIEEVWARQEYLGLYPVIKWHAVKFSNGTQGIEPCVIDSRTDNGWTLREWLTSSNIK